MTKKNFPHRCQQERQEPKVKRRSAEMDTWEPSRRTDRAREDAARPPTTILKDQTRRKQSLPGKGWDGPRANREISFNVPEVKENCDALLATDRKVDSDKSSVPRGSSGGWSSGSKQPSPVPAVEITEKSTQKMWTDTDALSSLKMSLQQVKGAKKSGKEPGAKFRQRSSSWKSGDQSAFSVSSAGSESDTAVTDKDFIKNLSQVTCV